MIENKIFDEIDSKYHINSLMDSLMENRNDIKIHREINRYLDEIKEEYGSEVYSRYVITYQNLNR